MKSKKAVMVGDKSSQALYMQELSTHAPMIWKLLSDAKLVPYSAGPIVRSASDYSYASTSYSGPNYRIIGDAGGMCHPLPMSTILILSCVQLLLTHSSRLVFIWRCHLPCLLPRLSALLFAAIVPRMRRLSGTTRVLGRHTLGELSALLKGTERITD